VKRSAQVRDHLKSIFSHKPKKKTSKPIQPIQVKPQGLLVKAGSPGPEKKKIELKPVKKEEEKKEEEEKIPMIDAFTQTEKIDFQRARGKYAMSKYGISNRAGALGI
jgi:hypothetical protein